MLGCPSSSRMAPTLGGTKKTWEKHGDLLVGGQTTVQAFMNGRVVIAAGTVLKGK